MIVHALNLLVFYPFCAISRNRELFLGIANVYRRGNRILALSQVCLLMRPGQYVAK